MTPYYTCLINLYRISINHAMPILKASTKDFLLSRINEGYFVCVVREDTRELLSTFKLWGRHKERLRHNRAKSLLENKIRRLTPGETYLSVVVLGLSALEDVSL